VASPLSVKCPGCGTSLKLKAAPAPGKKIVCPLCQEKFAPRISRSATQARPAQQRGDKPTRPRAPASAAPEDDFSALDEFDSFDDELGTYDDVASPLPSAVGRRLPARPKRAAKAGRREEKPAEGSSKGPMIFLIGGVALLGMSLLVMVTLFALKSKAYIEQKAEQARARLDLAYLPEYPSGIVSVRVDEVWKSPLFQSIAADPQVQAKFAELRETFGQGPEDITSVVFATGPPAAMMGHYLSQVGAITKSASGTSSATDERIIVVIRSRKPFDVAKLREACKGTGGGEYQGMSYMHLPENRYFSSWENSALYLPTPTTLVMGSVTSIREIIDSEGAPPDCAELDAVDWRQHMVMAILPKNTVTSPDIAERQADEVSKLREPKPGEAAPPAAEPVNVHSPKWRVSQIRVLAACLNFSDGIAFEYVGELASNNSAKEYFTAMAGAWEQGYGLGPLDGGMGTSPLVGALPGLFEIRSMVSKGIQTELNENRCTCTASIPAADLEAFRKNMTYMLPLAMTGETVSADELMALDALEGDDAAQRGANGQDGADPANAAPGADGAPADGAAGEGGDLEGLAEEPGSQFKNTAGVIRLLERNGAKVFEEGIGKYRILIENDRFSDAQLRLAAALRGLTNITVLSSSITDRGLEHIARNGSVLETLDLRGAKITNDGVKHLIPESFPVLQTLNLDNSQVGDGAIPLLVELKTLKVLVLRISPITPDGAKRLREEMPGCRIVK